MRDEDETEDIDGERARCPLGEAEAMVAKYWITFLVFSVFPAPDSPLGRSQSQTKRYRGLKVR